MERPTVRYENLSEVFSNTSADYNKQYCNIYLARLKEMKSILLGRIRKKWAEEYPVCQLHKLSEESYEQCIVIGTLFKNQKLKPSILKQLSEVNQLTPQPILSHFTDDSDELFIEDELQRYQVLGLKEELVTGITCALLGKDMGKGKFQVTDYLFAGYRDQIERPIFNDDLFIVFISGLDFVNYEQFLPNLELFLYWANGVIGDEGTISKLVRIIIAGNSVRKAVEKQKPTISMTSRITEPTDTIDAVKSFDSFISQLCKFIEVDVMPGEHDPSNHILPQKQMHYCMFPKSSMYRSFNQVPNPYFCSLDGLQIFGTSGQPVRDITWFSEIMQPLEAMKSCLKWGHLAPTAPDTLGCFPYYDKDPFIFHDCPHVFFAGNQPEFATECVVGEDSQIVRLISLPEFSESFQVVLLNLKNLDCMPIVFDTCKM